MALVFRGAVFQNIEGIEAIIDTRYIFLVIGPKIHRSRPRHLKIDVATAAERPLTWSLDADNGNPPGGMLRGPRGGTLPPRGQKDTLRETL